MGLRIIGRKVSGGVGYIDCLRDLTANGCFKAIDLRENEEIEKIVSSLDERLALVRSKICNAQSAKEIASQLDDSIREDALSMYKVQLPVEIETLLDLL